MFIFVVTEIPKRADGPHFYTCKCLLEKIAKDVCLVARYNQINRKFLEKYKPWAIVHSGAAASYEEYDVLTNKKYREIIKKLDVAQLGICGGHQIIAKIFGCKIGYIRKLRKDDPDLNKDYNPGMFKEYGIFPVKIIKRDPIFNGLGNIIRVMEHHMMEIKKLNKNFILLASTKDCKMQAYVHKKRPIYGVQFHPERSTKYYPDGLKILKNFFKIAREYNRTKY